MHTTFALVWVLAAGWPPPQDGVEPVKFAVVVAAANPWQGDATQARALVKRLFLKQQLDWPSGKEARVYARPAGSDAMQAFVKRVLDMSPAELARHWLQMKNREGATPPREVASVRLLGKHFDKQPDAIAIMTVAEAKAAGLRVLLEF